MDADRRYARPSRPPLLRHLPRHPRCHCQRGPPRARHRSTASPPDGGRRHLNGLPRWVTYGSRQAENHTQRPHKPRSTPCQPAATTALIMLRSEVGLLLASPDHQMNSTFVARAACSGGHIPRCTTKVRQRWCLLRAPGRSDLSTTATPRFVRPVPAAANAGDRSNLDLGTALGGRAATALLGRGVLRSGRRLPVRCVRQRAIRLRMGWGRVHRLLWPFVRRLLNVSPPATMREIRRSGARRTLLGGGCRRARSGRSGPSPRRSTFVVGATSDAGGRAVSHIAPRDGAACQCPWRVLWRLPSAHPS